MTKLYERPAELLQNLIRFDTTNPPGNETACILYIQELLKSIGIESILLEKAAGRPNLIARLKGQGKAAPLLLQGHVDVVTTAGQDWSHPPFAADIADGFIWGRGTLDMKGGVAMMLAAFMRAKAENLVPDGDVILCILSDEEVGGEYGAKFLVTEHAEIFKDVRYALGEFGGFTLSIGGKRFYPIMVAEKQICALKATVHGPAGHGSMPIRGGASAKLGQMLSRIDKKRLPVHVTDSAKEMFSALADNLNMPASFLIRQLLNPALTDGVLDLMGAQGKLFDPLLHNTISPTIFYGGDKINVIPSSISVEFDGRLLPTIRPETMLAEVQALLGKDVTVELLYQESYEKEADMGLFATLAGILREADPIGIPLPLLLGAVTDGRFFAQLGIQTYGFLPMQLAPDFNFSQTIHAANERIPVAALDFGTNAIYQALERFGR